MMGGGTPRHCQPHRRRPSSSSALLPIRSFSSATPLVLNTDFDIYALADFSNARFIALKNYLQLFSDPLFLTALRNTAYYVLVGGPLSVAVSLASALILNSRLTRFRVFFPRHLLPVWSTLVALPSSGGSLPPQFGLANYALCSSVSPVDWLGDPVWAMPAIILMSVWKGFGYNMIIFIAGLQTIPAELYEAARIDGASTWQQFRDITLPMLAPTTLFVGIITMINNFQLFAEPYVMTQGAGQQH
jgi:multiple sugar transport system permease protein